MAKSYFSRIFMKVFSRTRMFQTDVFFKCSLYQHHQKIYRQEFLSCKGLPLQFPLELMIHENNCKDVIWETLILKSTCQHVKKQFKLQPLDFPNSKRIRTPNEKNVRTGASKTFSSILNWSTEHICHRKNDLVNSEDPAFLGILKFWSLFFAELLYLDIYSIWSLVSIKFEVRFFPRSAKLGSAFLRVWVRVRFVNDANFMNHVPRMQHSSFPLLFLRGEKDCPINSF